MLTYILTHGVIPAMADDELDESYAGRIFVVRHCSGANRTYKDSVAKVPASQRKKYKRWMEMQIRRLAGGLRLSVDSFPQEASLPGLPGRPGKKFRALKRIPIRGYCWKSEIQPNTYFISHYILKKKDGLSDSDIEKVRNNWTRIEVNGDEY